jgi:hypothetical protein
LKLYRKKGGYNTSPLQYIRPLQPIRPGLHHLVPLPSNDTGTKAGIWKQNPNTNIGGQRILEFYVNPSSSAIIFFTNVQDHPKSPLPSGFFFCLYSVKVHHDILQSGHKWPTIWPTGHRGPYFVGHFVRLESIRFYAVRACPLALSGKAVIPSWGSRGPGRQIVAKGARAVGHSWGAVGQETAL